MTKERWEEIKREQSAQSREIHKKTGAPLVRVPKPKKKDKVLKNQDLLIH